MKVPGSSPRAWGTRRIAERRVFLVRFIPTRVGNTFPVKVGATKLAVHPHARGEHITGGGAGDAEYGSSPRAWGTRVRQIDVTAKIRFIPTRVGNTAT